MCGRGFGSAGGRGRKLRRKLVRMRWMVVLLLGLELAVVVVAEVLAGNRQTRVPASLLL